MDVTTINNYSSPNLDFNKNIPMPSTDGNELPANTVRRSDFSSDEVMMNLEDVKNFFFMLIGGNLAKVMESDIKGKNVNTMA